MSAGSCVVAVVLAAVVVPVPVVLLAAVVPVVMVPDAVVVLTGLPSTSVTTSFHRPPES